MPQHIMRRTGLSDDPNDYVFRCDGLDVGRCYLQRLAGGVMKWHRAIYIGTHLRRAETQFWNSFERMIAAGVVKLVEV